MTPALEIFSAKEAAAAANEPPLSAFVARQFTAGFERAIANRFKVVRPALDTPQAEHETIAMAKGCSHLIISVTEPIPAWVFDALAPELKVVATLSVGHNHIDLTAAVKHGVSVLVTPDVLSEACAEIAMMHILSAARRGHEAQQMVRSGHWTGWAPTQMLGQGLVGRTLGIFGMGRIGRAVAVRAEAFGLNIHYHNRSQLAAVEEADAFYHSNVDSLLRASNIFCICAPGGDGLAGFLNAERIAQLPDQAIVINIARGDMIDDNALIAALQSGKLFAAGLDVFNGEPEIHPGYAAFPNVILSPHIGSATIETREAMGRLLIDGIDALARGERPHNQIC